MKEKARGLMVRNKFIASQLSCDLCGHLDGAAPETLWTAAVFGKVTEGRRT